MANDTPITEHRGERIIAFMIASSIGLSVICILAIVIGTGLGIKDFGTGVWPVVVVLPFPGLVIGLILMISLIVISGIRRGREAKDARN